MKHHAKFTVGFLGTFLLVLSLLAWFHPYKEFSDTERRKLASFPTLSADSLLDGSFMTDFDSYTLDQFPFREQFRQLKAINQFYVFHQLDNHQIYIANGYASALVYPFHEASVQNALNHFQSIYDTYLADTDVSVYSCVIPDKNYYLAAQNGYPSIDYDRLFSMVKEGMPYAVSIKIADNLSVSSYYKTDTHWKQETLQPVAEQILSVMQPHLQTHTEDILLSADVDFYGVYYGQAALPMAAETISYYNNEIIEQASVFHADTNSTASIYDFDKLHGRDPYEFFLSGAKPLLIIDNPHAATDNELVILRDSFASSLAPLLLKNYRKITLIDTRYISSSYIGDYITFENQDVLFLYSSLILNSSGTLRP